MSTDDAVFDAEPYFDHRDRRVLEVLSGHEGELVRTKDLQRLYRRVTDVRTDETLRDRIKTLTDQGPFTQEDIGRWVFEG